MFKNDFIKDVNVLKSLSDKDFFDNFSYLMHVAIVQDEALYIQMIDDLYEICEKNEEVLDSISSKIETDLNILETKKTDAASFGIKTAEVLYDLYKDKYGVGECLALGCVAEGFISYKKNWLTKEEYYELRDMFVPFNLPISVELMDIDTALRKFCEFNSTNEDGKYNMILLKKIGKTVKDTTITIEEIKEAFCELNFDEAW